IESEFRAAALDALAAQAQLELTPELVSARTREMWERVLHSLSHRGVSREAYLKVAAREEQEILAEMQPDAERALRREAEPAAREPALATPRSRLWTPGDPTPES